MYTSSIYIALNIINACVPLFMVPLLTKYLSTEEYGEITIFQITLTLMMNLFGINVIASANKAFFDSGHTRNNNYKKYLSSCFALLSISFLTGGVSVLLIANQISNYFSIRVELLRLGLIAAFFTLVINLRLSQWQIRKKVKHYAILTLSNSFLNIVITCFLVVLLDLKVIGRVSGIVLAVLACGVYCITSLSRDLNMKPKFIRYELIKDALAYGLPLVPHVMSNFILTSADKIIVTKYCGLEMIGIYAVASQIARSYNLVSGGINKAYMPWLFENLASANDQKKHKIVKMTYIYGLLTIVIIVIVYISSEKIVLLLAGEKYLAAKEVLPILTANAGLQAMYLCMSNILFFTKKTGLLSSITVGSGIVTIALSLTLVSDYGIVGVAIGSCCGMICKFGLTFLAVINSLELPWFYIFSSPSKKS